MSGGDNKPREVRKEFDTSANTESIIVMWDTGQESKPPYSAVYKRGSDKFVIDFSAVDTDGMFQLYHADGSHREMTQQEAATAVKKIRELGSRSDVALMDSLLVRADMLIPDLSTYKSATTPASSASRDAMQKIQSEQAREQNKSPEKTTIPFRSTPSKRYIDIDEPRQTPM